MEEIRAAPGMRCNTRVVVASNECGLCGSARLDSYVVWWTTGGQVGIEV